jgi:DNA excision repair protein ERCC-2
MTEVERVEFLQQFSAQTERTLIGLAVMGGIFGEGIDLVGDRLIGVIVVGLGLPQLCLERNLIRQYYDQQGYDGFEYAYLFPGLNRVCQAAGRLIRSESDQGAILLLDNRFKQDRVQELLPVWWKIQTCDEVNEVR